MTDKKGVALLSGGLDSTTLFAMAKEEGYELFAISFDYGQRHTIELERAKNIAQKMGAARHLIAKVDLGAIGGSALTADIAVPKSGLTPAIPVTYVPARNTVFLSLALAYAETVGTGNIFIGVNAVDYSGYPDCRPAYITAYERMANLATKEAVEGRLPVTIHTPLIALSKKEIIETGRKLGIDYSLTWSCYDPTPHGRPCGLCDSCRLRREGFSAAGLTDPAQKGES